MRSSDWSTNEISQSTVRELRRTMRELMKVPHSEIKAAPDAEKAHHAKRKTMTIDNSLVFDITDITNIQFECKKCKARCAASLSDWKMVVTHCPNCRELWL